MNDRERNLILVLGVALFLVVNIFLYTSYQDVMKKNTRLQKANADKLVEIKQSLSASDEKQANRDWLDQYAPSEGTHGQIGAELATLTEKSGLRYGVTMKKRPNPTNKNEDEFGNYSSATVKVIGNAMDRPIYSWMVDLQNPELSRSITSIHIRQQRDDNTRMDCSLEITQWFQEALDEEEVN